MFANSIGPKESLLEKVTCSTQTTMITCVVLAALTALAIGLSAWGNVHVATLYGPGSILTHSGYLIILPIILAVTFMAAIVLLMKKCFENHKPLPPTLSPSFAEIATPGQIVPTVQHMEPIPLIPTYQDINAPIPGLLFCICHAEGDLVKKGDSLFQLEAMKSVNITRAPSDGKVSQIFAEKNSIVQSGQTVLRFEPQVSYESGEASLDSQQGYVF